MPVDYESETETETEREVCWRAGCISTDTGTWHNRRGLPICDSCHCIAYSYCDECETSVGDEHYNQDLERCQRCADEQGYSQCCNCSDWEHEDNLIDSCCSGCWEPETERGEEYGLEGLVVEYHHGSNWCTPNDPTRGNFFRGSNAEEFQGPGSFGDPDPNVYYGLEFEFENPNSDMRPAIERIMSAQFGHLETDGSLDEGLELITRPADMDAWSGLFGHEFAVARAAIIEAGGTFRAPKTGQHIHVSRSAFKDLNHLSRLAIFMQHGSNSEYIYQLSGKTRDNFNRYSHCNKYAPSHSRFGRVRSEFRAAVKHQRDDRSRAVNLTKQGTIEVRFFSGSNDELDVLGSIQMVASLVDYLRDMSSADAIAGGLLCQSFNTWLMDQEDYPLAKRLVWGRVDIGLYS